MREIILAGFLLVTSTLFGQTNCAIGSVANSNKIIYDENEMEKIINFSDYRAIFYGEGHVRDFEPEFYFNFIRHLNRKYHFRDVFMEIGYSAAYIYNLYLQTGDTLIFSDYKLSFRKKSYRNFWYNLYQYNKTLPENLKIIIHGLDFERIEIFKLLEKLKPQNAIIPQYLQTTFNDITRLSKDTSLRPITKTFKREFSSIKNSFSTYTTDFKKIYGAYFKIISSALNNNTPITTKVNPRNKVWYKNLTQVVSENNIEKFVGIFGGAHLDYTNRTALTVKLENNKLFKGHILNILSIYNHFAGYAYWGDNKEITEYREGEKELYDKYANKNCRATIISTEKIQEKKFNKKADYILFAKDIVVE